MNKTAEVVIIGGGVNGCAAAYYLAKKGVKDVVVLEATNRQHRAWRIQPEWRWCQTVWTRCKRTAICNVWY